ncbi:recombinase family protein [Nocardia sp. R7R-8]|uniref:recombinase family protein n=1 Tax=Nocardia sp. R7R-8 TaxID=3459304 RepID=UPI00403D741E
MPDDYDGRRDSVAALRHGHRASSEGAGGVCSTHQDLERQLVVLREYGIPDERIYTDRKTGAIVARPGWTRLQKMLREGDRIVSTNLHRYGRNLRECLDIVLELRDQGVGIKTLKDPIPIDTSDASPTTNSPLLEPRRLRDGNPNRRSRVRRLTGHCLPIPGQGRRGAGGSEGLLIYQSNSRIPCCRMATRCHLVGRTQEVDSGARDLCCGVVPLTQPILQMKHAAMTNSPLPPADQPIPLDLFPPDKLRAMRRQQTLVVLGFAVVVGGAVGLLFGAIAGVVVGLVVAVLVGAPWLTGQLLRRPWIVGTTIRTRPLLRLRVLDVAAVSNVELLVHRGRLVDQIALVLTTESDRPQVLLAGYTEPDAGISRELQPLGLLRLADALMHNELPSARAIAELLLRQMSAQQDGARLADRPLYRAIDLRPKGSVGTVLTDQEVRELQM